MSNKLANIPLAEIRLNPVALREVNRNSQAFLELKDSIGSRGVLNAILVREHALPDKDNKKYELIDGLQRFTASEMLDRPDIPAQILNLDEANALEAQIITNATRVETKPAEYARGLQRMLTINPTMTETELGAKISKSPAWISKNLALNKLNDNIKKLVDEGKIVVANAFMLTKLPSEEQNNWVDRAQTEDSVKFGNQVTERAKAIREASRAGRTVGEATFTPVPHFRKRTEVTPEMESPKIGLQLIEQAELTKRFKGLDLAREAFRLGVQFVMSMDAPTVAAEKQKWEQRKLVDKAEREKRAQERAEQRAKDAAAERQKVEQQIASGQPVPA